MISIPVVVLDTNVLVSAFCLPASLPGDLLRRCAAREFDLALSEEILNELSDVLRRPKIVRSFGATEEQEREFIDILRSISVSVPGNLVVDAVAGDPKDNKIVACAVEGHADLIISGDRHLKDLVEYHGIHILSPGQFHARLRDH